MLPAIRAMSLILAFTLACLIDLLMFSTISPAPPISSIRAFGSLKTPVIVLTTPMTFLIIKAKPAILRRLPGVTCLRIHLTASPIFPNIALNVSPTVTALPFLSTFFWKIFSHKSEKNFEILAIFGKRFFTRSHSLPISLARESHMALKRTFSLPNMLVSPEVSAPMNASNAVLIPSHQRRITRNIPFSSSHL